VKHITYTDIDRENLTITRQYSDETLEVFTFESLEELEGFIYG